MKAFPDDGASLRLFLVIVALFSSAALAAVARSQSPKLTRTVMDPAFASAGQKAGLEIWRIEVREVTMNMFLCGLPSAKEITYVRKDFKPVAYPKDQYGKFYTGDSYIVLNTVVNKRGEKFWDLHFWLGKETSQDEAGTAAILSVHLDEQLGGAPVQHREKQEHESQLFLSYFKSGVRYQAGGVVSGFRHVDHDAAETRLFQVKGSRNIRVKEVDPNISSMNKGDCFILDIEKKIFVYIGSASKRIEKLKANAAATQIRDQDHGGKPRITIVDDFSPASDFEEFFKALGGGSRDEVPEADAGGDDAQFETSEERAASLFRISDASGSLRVEPIGSRPLEPSLLDAGDVFVLDTGDSDVFVWIGRKASPQEKKESMKKADTYLAENRRPSWTHVERITQGAEPAAFTQYFRNWQGVGETQSRQTRSAKQPRLFHALLRPGSTKFHVEEVHSYDQDDLNTDDVMFLDVPDSNTVFLWIGNGADEQEKARSGEVVKKYLKEQGKEGTTITILNQGEEQDEFKAHFSNWNPELWAKQVDVRALSKNFK